VVGDGCGVPLIMRYVLQTCTTAQEAGAVLVHFGSTDQAIFDVLFGNFNPEGKLPFDMPSDWESVLNQKEDVPFDLENPLFRFGDGLSYD
jgi:beta-glucosidase